MKIGDHLYFAPEIKFADLDLTGERLPLQYSDRILGYYIEPAIRSADAGDAFASGLILVGVIDAIARVKYAPQRMAGERRKVGEEFERFVREELSSFTDHKIAHQFYEDFRNGLVHESRIKNGGQFSLDYETAIKEEYGILSINPRRLADEINGALSKYVKSLMKDKAARDSFLLTVGDEFSEEISGL